MPSRHRLLSVFTTTLLLSLVVHLPIATLSGMDAAIAQPANSEDQKTEADRLIQDAFELYQQGRFWNTLEIWQQVLKIQRDIDDRAGEGITLVNIGIVCNNLWQYSQALRAHF